MGENWDPIGHANNVVAMAAINNKLFAATSDNRLWWRDPVGSNVNWEPIGHANNVVAMTAINNKLFAATRDNRLWWRDPMGSNVNWDPIGHANNVVAMAAINNQLFAATSDNRLWWRDPVAETRGFYRLSVLTLNIAGALPDLSNPEIKIPWRERYNRIANGFVTYGLKPDILGLQEVTARKEWVLSRDPHEYESLHYLIAGLKDTTGIQYRIAYLGAADTNHPGLVQGEAVLYNGARLSNATPPPGPNVQPGDSRPTLLGVQERKSYPCRSPAPQFRDSCSLLDGEGVYGTSVYADGSGDKHFETGFVRFAFKEDQQRQFNLYNFHLQPDIPGSVEAAVALVETSERIVFGGEAFYPPLIVGDFNGGTERFPTFEALGVGCGPAPECIDYVLGGKRTEHTSKWGYAVRRNVELPNPEPNPDGLCAPRSVTWSDHCALVVDLAPDITAGSRISCITRGAGSGFPPAPGPLLGIGGVYPSGEAWWLRTQTAIQAIQTGHKFVVSVGLGEEAEVYVKGTGERATLSASNPQSNRPDPLLQLPACLNPQIIT
jgi:endonuclease/exonuclease/phosphatase family metal-dependent hydrolase